MKKYEIGTIIFFPYIGESKCEIIPAQIQENIKTRKLIEGNIVESENYVIKFVNGKTLNLDEETTHFTSFEEITEYLKAFFNERVDIARKRAEELILSRFNINVKQEETTPGMLIPQLITQEDKTTQISGNMSLDANSDPDYYIVETDAGSVKVRKQPRK